MHLYVLIGARWAGMLWLAAALSLARAAPLEVSLASADGRPLRDAAVWVESEAARAASRPLAGVEIVQRDKSFVPVVSLVTLGSAVSFPNRDTVRHHVYSFSPAKRFEIKLYVGTPAAPVVFDKTGIAVMGCNIHDSMAGWVVIVETPWFARSGDDGRASIADVPAGRHTLRVWHPDLPVGAPALSQVLDMRAQPQKISLLLGG